MKSIRIIEFDYIRIISLLAILLCHSCFDVSGLPSWLGRYLGLTFNFLFLVLSAFLLGQAWHHNGCQPYSRKFLTKRFGRLSKTYYPYLAVLFLFLYISRDYFSFIKIMTHTLYLPWFDKIEGFGHLWFITMIAICYAGCYVVSKLYISRAVKCIGPFGMIGGGILLDYIATREGLPGYLFPYLAGYLLVFIHAEKIISHIRHIPLSLNIVQALAMNTIGIFMFSNGIFDSNSFVAYFIGIGCAVSIFVLMFNTFSSLPSLNPIVWLSDISFEMYLVHEFFLGRYSVYKMVDNPIYGFLLLLAFSLAAATLLKFGCSARGITNS